MPEEYGGRGVDYRTYGLIVEQVGRGCSAMRTVVSVVTSLVCSSIVRWGSEDQKQEWLPRLCSGEALGCFGLTEPDTGSDASNLKTRAEKIDGGWRITGGKMWISLGNYAKLALIFAQTDPEKKHKGLACFLVPTDAEGFSTQEIHGKLGLKGSDTAELSLDGVEVSDDALMGEVGDGFKIAMSALDSGRYSVAAGCVGICQGSLDASVAYSKERKQFDRPIASFQLVQEMIADMVVQTDAAPRAGLARGLAEGHGPAEHHRDLDREALRDRGGRAVREPRHPGARRLRLRGRLPRGALPARRAGHDPVRGHVADPEADHRPVGHGRERDGLMATVLTETQGAVGVATLNRPDARNALSPEVFQELAAALEAWDADPEVRCIVIAGSDEWFAAGADIKDMASRGFQDMLDTPSTGFWPRLAAVRTPLIAAVSGYALGGGCELALACDMIVASERAEFGQPEILLGIIPGGGGTQRLARVLGKQRAMELILTGRRISALEAEEMGLVNKVSKAREWLTDALELAAVIARRPPLAVRLAKQAVLAADEMTLAGGLAQERRLFELAMATEDRVEGMQAFLEKRKPEFRGR